MLTVAMEEYTGPPKHLRERGVSCRTLAHSARENPRAKQTSWLADRSPPHEGSPYEWLLLDENDLILEGASSNFYAVISAPGVDRPELRTAGAGVLYGIARSIVLEVAPEMARVVLRAPSVRDLPRMQEAFITSASRGIVPVARIDGRSIGSDTPGDVTRGLISRYDTRAAELEEPLCASDSPRPVAR
jgi:branched-chain amino acid aminotransferase